MTRAAERGLFLALRLCRLSMQTGVCHCEEIPWQQQHLNLSNRHRSHQHRPRILPLPQHILRIREMSLRPLYRHPLQTHTAHYLGTTVTHDRMRLLHESALTQDHRHVQPRDRPHPASPLQTTTSSLRDMRRHRHRPPQRGIIGTTTLSVPCKVKIGMASYRRQCVVLAYPSIAWTAAFQWKTRWDEFCVVSRAKRLHKAALHLLRCCVGFRMP